MSFDVQKFMRTQFEPRIEIVDVPTLKEWFNDEPKWKVRGQTASEIAKSFESAGRNKNLDSIIKAISNSQEQVNELKHAIGLSDNVPDDIVKRLEQLVFCSVDPVVDMPAAVKLAETFPVEFYTLTNKIVELTGLGMNVPKLKASGKITA